MIGNLQGVSPNATALVELMQIKDSESREEGFNNNTKVLVNTTDNSIINETKNINKNINQGNSVDYSLIAKKMESTVNDNIGSNAFEIKYTVDKDTKKLVFKLINRKTKEVIEQYPPEVALKILKIVSQELDSGHVANAIV